MSKHVLVIEPRKEIIEDLEDRLVSINHTFDIVTSQVEAREILQKRSMKYSYVILSLNIPVKPERPPKMKFGLNLFKEMRQIFSDSLVPIVITLDHRDINANIALKIADKGACIAVKPFQDNIEFSLENAIFTALVDCKASPDDILDVEHECMLSQNDIEDIQHKQEDYHPRYENKESDFERSESDVKEDAFAAPQMTFYQNRVELCGVTVCGDSSTLMRRLLDLLKERTSEGNFKAYSSYELAVIADCESGQPGISACINNFKKKVNTFKEEHQMPGLSSSDQIIINDRTHGYRLEDHIEVIDKNSLKTKKNEIKYPSGLPGSQQKILDVLIRDKKASRGELQQKLKMSEYAVNRHLQSLRDAGLITCIGKSKATLWLPVDNWQC